MKNFFFSLLVILGCFGNTKSYAQNIYDTAKPKVYKIAVLAPLYLDSVFTDNKLRNDKSIPKFIVPALEFVQGAQIAFDSLPFFSKDSVEAFIYDTKSFKEPLSRVILSKKLDSVNLIIGAVKDADFKRLADFSLSKNIPFISATFPNDGGITGNPLLVIMNSTLKAHCEGIYSYILQAYGTDKIYLFRKDGVQEDKIAAYFKQLNEQEGKPLLNITTVTFDTGFSAYAFRKKLDSNRTSIIIGGSLDEVFAKNLTDACYEAKKSYPLTLIGMPNWDGFKFLTKTDTYKDFPVYFTTPYYNPRTNFFSNMLTDEYNRRYKSKPGDVVCKGFESVYYFTELLSKYPDSLMLHLNDSAIKVFNKYNFRPVSTQNNNIPDYYENKHLYIMKIMNGVVSRDFDSAHQIFNLSNKVN